MPELPAASVDPGPGFLRVPLLLQRILQAADGILDLAFDLVAFAFGGKLGVTDGLAGRFLDGALGLFGRADDTIFVHLSVSRLVNIFADVVTRTFECRSAIAAPALLADVIIFDRYSMKIGSEYTQHDLPGRPSMVRLPVTMAD